MYWDRYPSIEVVSCLYSGSGDKSINHYNHWSKTTAFTNTRGIRYFSVNYILICVAYIIKLFYTLKTIKFSMSSTHFKDYLTI